MQFQPHFQSILIKIQKYFIEPSGQLNVVVAHAIKFFKLLWMLMAEVRQDLQWGA